MRVLQVVLPSINEKTAKRTKAEAGGRDTSDGRADFLLKRRFPAPPNRRSRVHLRRSAYK